MTSSFATYASQFLTRQKQPGTSSLSSSQPLFFSFTTEEDDRPRAGGHACTDSDLDDSDDPQLAAYNRYLAWLNANPHANPADYPGN